MHFSFQLLFVLSIMNIKLLTSLSPVWQFRTKLLGDRIQF